MSFFGDIWDNTAGGLLWKPLKKATGLTDAQMIGLGGVAAAPFVLPAVGAMGGAGAAGAAVAGLPGKEGGMLDAFAKYAAPASSVANIADKAGAFGGQPMQAPQAQFQQGPGFAGLLTPTEQVDPEKRRQAQQMAVQGLLGGYRG